MHVIFFWPGDKKKKLKKDNCKSAKLKGNAADRVSVICALSLIYYILQCLQLYNNNKCYHADVSMYHFHHDHHLSLKVIGT